MTPQQLKTMKLALEALESCTPQDTSTGHVIYAWHDEELVNGAITALKERLADPMRDVQRLGQEIEQEPVAHCKVRPLRGDESFPKVEIDWVNQPVPGPLYATPPQRKPLTDEQVISKALHLSGLGTSPDVLQFARAIEAAHGIKEKT
jgi:hypothetical protein